MYTLSCLVWYSFPDTPDHSHLIIHQIHSKHLFSQIFAILFSLPRWSFLNYSWRLIQLSGLCHPHFPSSPRRTEDFYLCSHNTLHTTYPESPLAVSISLPGSIPLQHSTAFFWSWTSPQLLSTVSAAWHSSPQYDMHLVMVHLTHESTLDSSGKRNVPCSHSAVSLKKKCDLQNLMSGTVRCLERTTIPEMSLCSNDLPLEWNLMDEDKWLWTIFYSQPDRHHKCNVFFQYNFSNSSTPAGCPTIQFNSGTIFLELASDPITLGLGATRLHLIPAASPMFSPVLRPANYTGGSNNQPLLPRFDNSLKQS